MMSNALCILAAVRQATLPRLARALAATTAPATAPAGPPDLTQVPPMMMSLVAVGLCVLVVWIVRRSIRPRKLTLIGTPGRPNRVNPLHVLVLLGVWFGGGRAATALLAPFFPGRAHEFLTVLLIVIQLPWLVACLLVAKMTFRLGLRRGLGFSGRHWIYDTARGLIGYLAVLPVCVGLSLGSIYLLRTYLPSLFQHMQEKNLLDHPMLQALGEVPLIWQVGVIFSAAVLAPLAEEVFFRGIFQSMLRRYTRSPWAAVLITSAFFAGFHYPLWHTMPALFALSVALGYNYERSGRLVSPIIIHVLFNAAFLVARLAEGG